MKETLHLKAKGLLALGEKPKDIAEKLDINYQKVLKLRRDLQKENENANVEKLQSIDPVAVQLIVDKARDEAPTTIVNKLEAVQEGINGLQKLDNEFQTTFSLILGKAENFLANDKLKPSEWVAITNALSNAYSNIFNNKGVNVNVNNGTQFSDTKLSMFKNSMRS